MSGVRTFNQLLAEDGVGAQNMGWWDGRSQFEYGVPAIDAMSYYDEYHNEHYKTYCCLANYYERNRRINGAYGNAYFGECNWLSPDLFHIQQEDHFYYLQDLVHGGPYQNLFVQGVTWYQRKKPNIDPNLFDGSFVPDRADTYYRIDILGSEYPYNNPVSGEKIDAIIQQMIPQRNSNKIQVSFSTLFYYGQWHGEYQLRIPVTIPVFNDKLYDPPPIVINPPGDPIVVPPVDLPPAADPTYPEANYGGNTTDTGPTANIDIAYDPYFAPRDDPQMVYQDFPGWGGWRRWFRWE